VWRLLRRPLSDLLWLKVQPILQRLALRALSLKPIYQSKSGDLMVYLKKLTDGWMVGVLIQFCQLPSAKADGLLKAG
jgi:hypothetical protein